MHTRFAAEGKPGVTSRRGANYSTWWNGGLRTTVYFHNMIGLLTETIGHLTPIRIPFLPERHLPDSSLHAPIAPQEWHFRQSIEYSLTANYAVLDIASRNREHFLFNIYRMGKNSIERGSRDSWTPAPRRIEAARAALETAAARDSGQAAAGGGRGTPADFARLLRDPAARDPRGYVLPSDQPDFPTATKFVNALIKTGVVVHRTTGPLTAAGKTYPRGSYVVKAAQAFRPHVLDMFEPQDHPDDIPYPGGPPTRPYDAAGWTLAFQMGARFDRILDEFDGPMEKLAGLQAPPPGRVTGTGPGYLLGHAANDAFTAVNRLLKSGEDVLWITRGEGAGSFFIPARASTRAAVERLAADLGLDFTGAARPSGEARSLAQPRIALADVYGGSMPSGWTRWILEQYEFPFDVVYPQVLDAGGLAAKYDVIVFPSGAAPAPTGPGRGAQGPAASAAAVPAEFRHMLGAYTAAATGPELRKFVGAGGTVLGIGRSAMNVAQLFDLPVRNHLLERTPDGATRPLPPEKYYVPGSVLRMAVDNTAPVAHGIANPVDVFFDNSPVFRLDPDASLEGVRPIAWFDTATPLRSGWAYGQGYLENGVQVLEAAVGTGRVFLFAPEITFRAQPHGTFKFLFNALHLASRTGSAQGGSRD
jgi:hypothetical protein